MNKSTSKLIAKDGHEIKIGEEAIDFRGNTWTVTGWRDPYDESSTGRVFLKAGTRQQEFSPE